MKSLDSIRWRRLRPLWFGVLLAAWAAPSSAQACATCFGASDDKMAQGMNMGIMALLAVVAWQVLAVPHRVRAACVQAGVTSRQGRLPWIFWARPVGDAVLVSVGHRSGTTVGDLRDAAPVVRGACGAGHVDVVSSPARPDRAVVVVVRPRRGLW